MIGKIGSETKCPFAADKFTNPDKFSYKTLELTNSLKYSKGEYQNGIQKLYQVMQSCLVPTKDTKSILQIGNQLLEDEILKQVDELYDNNYEVTNQIIAGLGHAIRTITSIRDVYIELGGSSDNTKNGIRKIIYQLATIGLYDLPLSGLRLKINQDLHTPIKNIPYDKNNFFIDENNILQFQKGIVEDLLGKGRCPAIGAKTEEENILIIDDMIDRLVG